MVATKKQIVLDPDKEYEVIAGQPQEKVMGGARHGGVGVRLIARLEIHVEQYGRGGVYGSDKSFQIGTNEWMPDVSFVAADRIPPEGEPEGIWSIAPDLAVEIISPNDLYEKVSGKIKDYFAAGVRQVWVISPEHRTITIYHSLTRTTILSDQDELVCEQVIPGFRCAVQTLFRNPARSSAV